MTDRELMQQALQALEFLSCGDEIDEALIVALRQRLEQPTTTAGYAKKIESLVAERDALKAKLAQPEQDDEPATCWKCGEDGGTSCGAEACGLIEAQPEQEPVAYINVEKRRLEFAEPMVWHTPTVVKLERIPLYTHQRTWVGLTDEETAECFEAKVISDRLKADAKRIEAKLKQKNGYAEEKNI